jgi:hypothetical protein
MQRRDCLRANSAADHSRMQGGPREATVLQFVEDGLARVSAQGACRGAGHTSEITSRQESSGMTAAKSEDLAATEAPPEPGLSDIRHPSELDSTSPFGLVVTSQGERVLTDVAIGTAKTLKYQKAIGNAVRTRFVVPIQEPSLDFCYLGPEVRSDYVNSHRGEPREIA